MGERNSFKFEKYSGEAKEIKIDEKDKKILKQLSQNANQNIIDISLKTNLSLDVVKYRLRQLKQKAINSNRVIIN